jgi:SAM-dependent methyltransferase
LSERDRDLRRLAVADQGAGRLRHLDVMARTFGCTFVVETRLQLLRRQELFGKPGQRVFDIARIGRDDWCATRPVSAGAFDRSRLELDVVFSVCVYDAVPSHERPGLARAAYRNLRPGGIYVLIAPRNDASILARCTPENAYDDGHVFTRYGVSRTYFTNFRSTDRLVSVLSASGFEVVSDNSVYRHVWLILQRPNGSGNRARATNRR